MAEKRAKYPVRLILPDGAGPCGCRFGYKHGFKIVCEFHIAQREAISEQRKNFKPIQLWPKQKPRKRVKPVEDSPEFVQAIRNEIARRTEILRVERAKIKKPTSKLTRKQRDHLHTFAFTAEQVRAELLDKKGKRR